MNFKYVMINGELSKLSAFKFEDNILHICRSLFCTVETAFLHILEIIEKGLQKSVFLNGKQHDFAVIFLEDQGSDISTAADGSEASAGFCKNHGGSFRQLREASGSDVPL